MELIKQISELTSKDSFMVCVSVKRGDDIETQCMTKNFSYADIPLATQDINKNIQKIAVEVAPSVPSALQSSDVITPVRQEVVVYAEGEEK